MPRSALPVPDVTPETWLRPNRRAIAFGCIPPALVALVGAWLAFGGNGSGGTTWHAIGVLLAAAGLVTTTMLAIHLRRPRVAYHDGYVLFYLRAGQPIAVPVGIVEAFFLGQGSANLPGRLERHESVHLVARLAQRATEWARQDVKPSLGNWCGGYVTIRGTWCEPLTNEVVRRLNRRLKEVQTESHGRH